MARNNEKIKAVDITVGANIQNLRIKNGWSRKQLAERIDVTHQQVQKYEKGTNSVRPGRLKEIARIFYVPIVYFFDEENIIECPRGRLLIELFRELSTKTDQQKEAVLAIARAMSCQK